MAHLEALFEFRTLADFLVASEVLVPENGYPYDMILQAWDAQFPLSARAAAELFVDQTIAHYLGSGESLTHAAVDASQLDTLAMELAELASAVTIRSGAESEPLKQAIAAAFEPLDSDGVRDLDDFLGKYYAQTSDNTIRDRLEDVQAAWTEARGYCREVGLPETTGIGLYLPSEHYFGVELRDEYRPMAFNQATHWLEMLEATGVPSGSSGEIRFAEWEPNWCVSAAWTDAGLPVEPLIDSPDGKSGSPLLPDGLTGIVSFSPDSLDSGVPEEWAKLEAGAPGGCYVLSLSYAFFGGPPAVSVHLTLADDLGSQQQDLGYFTIANGSTEPVAVLTYATTQFRLADWIPGDRVELSWASDLAELDIEIRDPLLNTGTPLEPDALDEVIMFSADSADAGVNFEWARLHSFAPCGGYLVSATYKAYDGFPPDTIVADLMLYDIEGTLKQDLGQVLFDGLDFGGRRQMALLTYNE